MLTDSDFTGTVPYHQDCDETMLRALPVGTYVKLVRKSGNEFIGRVTSKRDYWDNPMIETAGRKMMVRANTDKVVPLPDQDALNLFPPGTKVHVDTRYPHYGWPMHVEGVVSGHLGRRAQVWLTFDDGTTVERTYYVSQLYSY